MISSPVRLCRRLCQRFRCLVQPRIVLLSCQCRGKISATIFRLISQIISSKEGPPSMGLAAIISEDDIAHPLLRLFFRNIKPQRLKIIKDRSSISTSLLIFRRLPYF